jgi:hypothetical protein
VNRPGRRLRREAATAAVIGQNFATTGYRGALVQWTGGSAGFTTERSYAMPHPVSPLKGRFESSRSFSGCTRSPQFPNQYSTSAVQPCSSCSTLGSLNKQTTSERWSR